MTNGNQKSFAEQREAARLWADANLTFQQRSPENETNLMDVVVTPPYTRPSRTPPVEKSFAEQRASAISWSIRVLNYDPRISKDSP